MRFFAPLRMTFLGGSVVKRTNVLNSGLEKLSNTEMDLPRLVAPRRAKRKPEVEAHGTYRCGIAHAETRRIPEIIVR